MQLDIASDLAQVQSFLYGLGWLPAHERLTALERPGEGNMNLVLRAVGTSTSFILKQARPYVQKFPSIPAPLERIHTEATFYQVLANYPALRAHCPQLLGFDPASHLMALEDLGAATDCSIWYQPQQQPAPAELESLVDFLSTLHNLSLDPAVMAAYPTNLPLRQLNHQHLFVFPYRNDTGFDLDTIQPGLQALAQPFRTDLRLLDAAQQLGEIYLGRGPCLLHGDFYPGSWLKQGEKMWIIDPEFSFCGPAAYDFGIMLGHGFLIGLSDAQLASIQQRYRPPQGFDAGLARQFAGMEILRRLIGLAQLPLALSLTEKKQLLDWGRTLMLGEA